MKLFVYGTLKKGYRNAQWLNRQPLLHSNHMISGYKLLHAHFEDSEEHPTAYDYPIMIFTGNDEDKVVGEVYRISDSCRKVLDMIEVGYILREVDTELHAYLNPNQRLSAYLPEVNRVNGIYKWTKDYETIDCTNSLINT